MLLYSIVVYSTFYTNRLAFSVFSQNIGESVTFVTPLNILDTSVLTLLSQWYSWILLLGTVEPQLYSSELFCHSGLEPYIWVYSSLLPGY